MVEADVLTRVLFAKGVAESMLSDDERKTLEEYNSTVDEIEEQFGGAKHLTLEQEAWVYKEAFQRVPGSRDAIRKLGSRQETILFGGRDE